MKKSVPGDLITRRTLWISLLCIGLGLIASLVAESLTWMIAFFTNLAYYGRFSVEYHPPGANTLGIWAVGVPIAGGLVVGLMARFGSRAIRGHGIPEAMENILYNDSRIPGRLIWLKPLSAAVAIGTGGPFGAEGPIIATGGSLGSYLGQLLHTTSGERKTLLAAGAAAGMAATFGSPISAVLLAIELLLFEFRPRSYIPVALASTVAAGMRFKFHGGAPMCPMPALSHPTLSAVFFYAFEGMIVGVLAVVATKIVYWIEDAFEKLPVHWMWWPAVGAVAVGGVGYFFPRTLGVGYENIREILNGGLHGAHLFDFCIMKFVSWSVALGSGTSGGTLAPLLSIGGGTGAILGSLSSGWLPQAGIDPLMAGLVGMAAMFAGASRALLASIVLAFELTHQTLGLAPLLGGCTAAFVVSALLMKSTIMTEKIARRGRHVPVEYWAAGLADH